MDRGWFTAQGPGSQSTCGEPMACLFLPEQVFCFYSLQGKLKRSRDRAVGFRCAMPVLGAAFGVDHRPFRGLLWTHFLAWPHSGFAPRPHTPHMLQTALITMAVPLMG